MTLGARDYPHVSGLSTIDRQIYIRLWTSRYTMARKSLLRAKPIPQTYEDAIQWLREYRAIPIWAPETTKAKVYFRRVYSPKDTVEKLVYPPRAWTPSMNKHLIEILKIHTENDCETVRRLVLLGLPRGVKIPTLGEEEAREAAEFIEKVMGWKL